MISFRSVTRIIAQCAPAAVLLGVGTAIYSPSQASAQATGAVSVVHTLNTLGMEGALPIVGPIKASDGNYYGVTDSGGDPNSGDSGGGTIYKLTPAGQFSVAHTFLNNPLADPPTTEGYEPYVLIQGKDGNLYGLCHGGGVVNETPAGGGTLFRLALDGTFTKLYDFDTGDPTPGLFPVGLVQGTDGNLYGLTRDGGSDGPDGGGTFFRFALGTNTWTLLYTFEGGAGPGEEPQAQLIVGQDGNFYGVTTEAGTLGGGTGSIFKATPAGAVTQLYGFPFSGGARGDYYPLVQVADGSLYGVSTQSGENGQGTIYHINTDGSNFSVVHDFAADDSDGGDPDSIVLGSDGNLYGSTIDGPPSSSGSHDGYGTYFQLTPGGTLTTLSALHGANGGPARPFGQLLETSPDVFLGVSQTNNMDQSGNGTVDQLTVSGSTAPFPFFTGETALGNGVYYLAFPSGNYFGYYSFLTDTHYIYHFDLGYEYIFDAADGKSGVYLYDFKSNGFFYSSPSFPFPYLYDFSQNSVVYYYPDPSNPGHYNTDGYRFFYVFNTGQIISK